MPQIAKYGAVLKVTLLSSLAYGQDVAIRALFMAVVLVVFVQLWTTTYDATGGGTIAGFTLANLVWYLVLTETVVLSAPRVSAKIDQEVKSGDLAYGLAVTVFGNSIQLATVIAQGQLDYYLALPKNALLHVLVSRMSLSGWGDLGFGLVAFAIAGQLDPAWIALAALLVLTSAAIFVAFQVLVGSLAFFVGNAEVASTQAQGALLMFSTYPGPIYRGWVKLLLFTAIPAAFMAHVPVELLRAFDPLLFAALLGFTVGLWAAALLVFRAGLRRYESGNLISLRG
ncbi:MAG: ABC-2 family transporter protein [Chloroflexi bacterium]|nr:ABC-2 family transporter protein [Chloroflexota bacterium]